jgi:hypothetical protein
MNKKNNKNKESNLQRIVDKLLILNPRKPK